VKGVIVKGFLVWLLPFVIAMAMFGVRSDDRALFESVMAVVLVVVTVFFGLKQLNKIENVFQGLLVGVVWMLISIAIDLILFLQGPMKMELVDYFKDIGITYLIMPVVVVGLVYSKRR
jgi:hypothetical protein